MNINKIFRTCTEGINAGKRVSDFSFKSWFQFYDKKREDLAIFFIKDFLHLIKFELGHK